MEDKIRSLVASRCQEEDLKDCFLVGFKRKDKKLEVFIDSDGPLSFDKCKTLSRYLEEHIDKNGWIGEDYQLDVSSPGIEKPLVDKRQYPKHVGRKVEIITTEGERKKGEMKAFENEVVFLSYEETKKQGKKKIKQQVTEELSLAMIKEIKIKISF